MWSGEGSEIRDWRRASGSVATGARHVPSAAQRSEACAACAQQRRTMLVLAMMWSRKSPGSLIAVFTATC